MYVVIDPDDTFQERMKNEEAWFSPRDVDDPEFIQPCDGDDDAVIDAISESRAIDAYCKRMDKARYVNGEDYLEKIIYFQSIAGLSHLEQILLMIAEGIGILAKAEERRNWDTHSISSTLYDSWKAMFCNQGDGKS